MTLRLLESRPRVGDSEKMTVNLGVVDLGQVDLLVQEGFYSNRSDLVRTAVRNLLATHADTLKQTVARKTLTLGLQHLTRADLERSVAEGVETQAELDIVMGLGVDFVQGYYFARPMPPADFVTLLLSAQPLAPQGGSGAAEISRTRES